MQHGVKRMNLSEQARRLKLEKDRAKIAHYRALTQRVLDEKKKHLYTTESLQNTTALLELNPEFNAVWNFRRDIFIRLFETGSTDKVDALNSDLHMSMELMKRYPKCYWIWNHRRWCLETLQTTENADWARELAIALKFLAMDSRNFHGWHYRRYVISNIESVIKGLGLATLREEIELHLREFNYTTEAISKSTSNFSAWHNRTKLISKIFGLLQEADDLSVLETFTSNLSASLFKSPLDLLKHELDLVKTGMYMDADDTSVWLYLQWLFTVKVLIAGASEELLIELLKQQLRDVEELNELEKEDSPTGLDNVWCLKTIVFLNALLIQHEKDGELTKQITDESLRILNLLVVLDPLRKGHYLDQLQGKASIVC